MVAKSEDEESESGPGAAHSGTEHSVHEAEAQHEEDGRSGKAEEAGGDSCPAEISAGRKCPPEKWTGTPAVQHYSLADSAQSVKCSGTSTLWFEQPRSKAQPRRW